MRDRVELRRLAEEQAALRRVATLVARGAPPAEVFAAVPQEVSRLLRLPIAALQRYDDDGATMTVVAAWSDRPHPFHPGTRWPLDGPSLAAQVLHTGLPARVDDYTDRPGVIAAGARAAGLRSVAGAPIIVNGEVWGLMTVASRDALLPDRVEGRLAGFTELVATAVANAESRAELAASRARIVATADATRRQIERDLHDGAQQQLVSLALDLRAAQAAAPPELGELRAELSGLGERLTGVLEELREIALGIHPAVLSEGGLGPALKVLTRRCAVPVELAVDVPTRPPERVEIAAYYVVSEALANLTKHARATVAHVEVLARDRRLHLSVRDDGVGGAAVGGGSGLVGLSDRVEALGGTISITSPPGQGTTLQVDLPAAPS